MDLARTALSIPSLLTTQPGLLEPPAAPELVVPKLLAVPAPGFRERLAAGLASSPGYTPQAYESRGSRFGRGLLAGAAQGFSRSGLLTMKGEEERIAAKNAVERASADRANTIANETWRAKLSDYYKTKADRTGKLEVTKQMASETGLPEGSFAEPVQIATLRASKSKMDADSQPVAVSPADVEYLRSKKGLAPAIEAELQATGGKLAPKSYSAFQDAVRNARDSEPKVARGTTMGDGPTAPAGDDAAIDYAAQYLNDTGEMLPLGMGNGNVRLAIIRRAAQMRGESGDGQTLAEGKAKFASNKTSLTRLRGMVDAVTAFENTALANSGVLLRAMEKIPDVGVPLLNAPLRAASKYVGGSDEMAAYETARQIVVPEFAKLLSNPNLTGVLSDNARHELERVISGDATLAQTRALIHTLTVDAANRKRFYQQQVDEIQGRISRGGREASRATPEGDDEFARFRKGRK